MFLIRYKKVVYWFCKLLNSVAILGVKHKINEIFHGFEYFYLYKKYRMKGFAIFTLTFEALASKYFSLFDDKEIEGF